MTTDAAALRREYDLEDLPDLPAPVVLDVGANHGHFALYAMTRWPGAQLHCYEPHPATYALLRERADLASVGATCAAVLHPARGKVRLYMGVNCDEECSTRDDVRWPHVSQKLDEWIDVDSIDSATLPSCDVLKVDTEGAEVEILTGYRHLGTVRVLLVEAHAVRGDIQGQMRAITALAVAAGLRPVPGGVLRFAR